MTKIERIEYAEKINKILARENESDPKKYCKVLTQIKVECDNCKLCEKEWK